MKRVLRIFPGLVAEYIRLARADVLRHQAGKEMQYSHLTSPAFDWVGSSFPLQESKVAVLYGQELGCPKIALILVPGHLRCSGLLQTYFFYVSS